MNETPIEKLLKTLVELASGQVNFSLWLLVKIMVLIGLGIYIGFAVIVIRQVSLMTKTLNTPFELLLKLIAWLHLIVAIGIFFLALIIPAA
jgi:hypothetical protein